MESFHTQKLCYHCMQNTVENGVCRICGSIAEAGQPVPYALPYGTVLHGCYLLGAVLGAGGFGITYIALRLPEGRRVAIKEYFPVEAAFRETGDTVVVSSAGGAEAFRRGREQFLKEAQTIYGLRGYPGIVSVEKLFEENNTAYFCMEYLDGQDLKHRVAQAGGRLSAAEAMQTFSPVLDALDYIHKREVIHRDVSPDNIFLCRNGGVKLIDFGAAYARSRDDLSKIQLIVKQGYAPVEQYYQDGNVGPWSDLYALASTMYFCLTGTVPQNALQRAQKDELMPPTRLGAAIPASVEAAILKGMSVERSGRFSSAAEMKLRLLASAGETRAISGETASAKSLLLLLRQGTDQIKGAFQRKTSAERSASRAVNPQAQMGIFCASGVYVGNTFPLTDEPLLLGRDSSRCGVVFPPDASGVSRVHCEIRANAAARCIVVRDVGSRYGTQIVEGTLLREGQEQMLPVGAGFLIGKEYFTVVLVEHGQS